MPEKTVDQGQEGPAPDAVEVLSDDELEQAIYYPHLAVEHILGHRDRLSRTVREGDGLEMLIILLLFAGLAFSAPYSLLSPVGGPFKTWNIFIGFALFTGSMLICLPCLYIFNKYVGFKLDPVQSLVMGLVASAVAAIITFGFFPILWFIDYTTGEGIRAMKTTEFISNLLLAIAFFMGLIHMARCFLWSKHFVPLKRSNKALIFIWFVLLAYLTYRMALVLEII